MTYWKSCTPLFACVLVACGGSGGSGEPAADGGGADSGGVTPSVDSGTSAGRTLSTCTTNITADAPAFYRTYFKCVTITMNGESVVIASESLPPHLSYYYGEGDPSFEAFDTSRGPEYNANPNLLTKKAITITIPSAPVAKPGLIVNAALVDGVVATSTEEYGLGTVGVALDSVALFNPLARPGDDIEAEKYTFDRYDAHPSPDGTYHYHRSSPGPLEVLAAIGATTSTTPGSASVELYGIMCDGTLVLGCTELDGSAAPDGTTLDAQGGHISDVKDASGTLHFASRYHTHVCPSSVTGRKYTPEIQYYTACAR